MMFLPPPQEDVKICIFPVGRLKPTSAAGLRREREALRCSRGSVAEWPWARRSPCSHRQDRDSGGVGAVFRARDRQWRERLSAMCL